MPSEEKVSFFYSPTNSEPPTSAKQKKATRIAKSFVLSQSRPNTTSDRVLVKSSLKRAMTPSMIHFRKDATEIRLKRPFPSAGPSFTNKKGTEEDLDDDP